MLDGRRARHSSLHPPNQDLCVQGIVVDPPHTLRPWRLLTGDTALPKASLLLYAAEELGALHCPPLQQEARAILWHGSQCRNGWSRTRAHARRGRGRHPSLASLEHNRLRHPLAPGWHGRRSHRTRRGLCGTRARGLAIFDPCASWHPLAPGRHARRGHRTRRGLGGTRTRAITVFEPGASRHPLAPGRHAPRSHRTWRGLGGTRALTRDLTIFDRRAFWHPLAPGRHARRSHGTRRGPGGTRVRARAIAVFEPSAFRHPLAPRWHARRSHRTRRG